MEEKKTGLHPQGTSQHTIDPPPAIIPTSPSPIDESPDLHDPYSELNLFLTRKIKEEFKNAGTAKKWSIYVQEKLIEKITPEFKKKFPHYRLGVSALKKVWEKFSYFSQAFDSQKEALTQEGKLNLGYLIRENLKQFLGIKKSFSLHPYLLAQQLALKISECLAAYDGIRPMLQHITKTIWAVKRHLIPPEQVPATANPYDEFDTWDKLIIKFMLEISGNNPRLSQEELQVQVREKLYSLKDNPPLEKEMINLLIDNPEQGIEKAAETAQEFIKKARALALSANWIEVEHKINLWTLQGDLVYRCLRIESNQLLDHLRQKGSVEEYIEKYQFLADFVLQVEVRAEILMKFEWYTSAPSTQSTAERFFEWHQSLSPEQLEELCKKQLPMLPFDKSSFSKKQV
ncbi:MAG TPA: hypothetical protein VFU89_06470 [Rhabdochlamydiaceae bacterium]|nr:hypothetical protein [Rhabdochlamydiaceae bacterium]